MIEKVNGKSIVVALAGAPNVGKSTVFNLLTGLSQHVGNWPGKTVEQKTGVLRRGTLTMNIVDLPGTYSLTANSIEEQIARDYLIKENPDVVVAVLNAASLERNLYLVAELIELSPRLIIALNMMDVAQQQGMKIDVKALAKKLNIPVIPIAASKNRGIDELLTTIEQEYSQTPCSRKLKHIEYGSEILKVIEHVEQLLDDSITEPYPKHWTAMKLLEGDTQINKLVMGRIITGQLSSLDSYLRENESAAVTIATLRFAWVEKMMNVAQERPPLGRVSLTEKIDRAATHPIAGLFILLMVLGLIFGLVYSIGIPIQKFLEVHLIESGRAFVNTSLPCIPTWVRSLLADGILSGVGTVLTFIPILMLFFAAWAFMEDVGYMARAAFVTDRFMHLLGLHGKSVLPLALGFGCNVPAILGTRIIDSPRSRLLTIIVTPLVPCTGRMAVITLIAAAFFGSAAIVVSIGIVIFSLIMLIITGIVMNRFVVGGEDSALLMELPLYHLPNPRIIRLVTWQNTMAFIKRAGTIILVVSLIIWILATVPYGDINTSILSNIGKFLEPLGRLMGFNWQVMVALLSSFIAKENTIATLGTLIGGQGTGLATQLQTLLTPASALAFLVVQVLFIPCIATVAAIRQETKTWRWPIFTIVFQLILSFSMAILVYQIARLTI
ncbi:MAG: ferrous iron transport protein B [Dehalococcoidales bacterium]|nr:ferrous iron transport protein B [Dehalococcoidales bacterium]